MGADENITDKQLKKEVGGGKLCTLGEWIDLLNMFKSKHRRCETNCYIPLPVLEEYIKEGRLSYKIISDNTLWLLERERDYYLGYYYVSKGEELNIEPQNLDMVIYLIGSEKRYADIREEELVKHSCIKYRRNLEYMFTSDKHPELEKMDGKCQRFIKKMGLHYTVFHAEDYESVYQLWSERIDKYSVKDMLKSRIRQMETKEECITVRDSEGNIAASCVFEVNGAVGFSENIATAASYNGSGVGGALLCKSFLDILSRGCTKDCMWVWEGNWESRRITERFAQLTGRFSQQLLLKKA